nr:hypothetical protein [Pimelobacter simplex]
MGSTPTGGTTEPAAQQDDDPDPGSDPHRRARPERPARRPRVGPRGEAAAHGDADREPQLPDGVHGARRRAGVPPGRGLEGEDGQRGRDHARGESGADQEGQQGGPSGAEPDQGARRGGETDGHGGGPERPRRRDRAQPGAEQRGRGDEGGELDDEQQRDRERAEAGVDLQPGRQRGQGAEGGEVVGERRDQDAAEPARAQDRGRQHGVRVTALDDDERGDRDRRQAERPERLGVAHRRGAADPGDRVGERGDGHGSQPEAADVDASRPSGVVRREPEPADQHQRQGAEGERGEEEPAPAEELGEQPAGHRPDRGRRPGDCSPDRERERPPARLGVDPADQRRDAAEHERTGHPLRGAPGDQPAGVRSEPGEQGRTGEPGDADDVHAPGAEGVPDRARAEQEPGEGDGVGVDDPLHGGRAGVEVGADRGQGDDEDRGVEHQQEGAEAAGDQRSPAGRRGCGRHASTVL